MKHLDRIRTVVDWWREDYADHPAIVEKLNELAIIIDAEADTPSEADDGGGLGSIPDKTKG